MQIHFVDTGSIRKKKFSEGKELSKAFSSTTVDLAENDSRDPSDVFV